MFLFKILRRFNILRSLAWRRGPFSNALPARPLSLQIKLFITRQWAVKSFFEERNLEDNSWIRTRGVRVGIQNWVNRWAPTLLKKIISTNTKLQNGKIYFNKKKLYYNKMANRHIYICLYVVCGGSCYCRSTYYTSTCNQSAKGMKLFLFLS